MLIRINMLNETKNPVIKKNLFLGSIIVLAAVAIEPIMALNIAVAQIDIWDIIPSNK